MYPTAAIIVMLFSASFSLDANIADRNFIGVNQTDQPVDYYTAHPGRSLLFFAGFNDGDTTTNHFTKVGTLDFNVSENALKVPVRTLKRNAKSGGYYSVLPIDISANEFVFSADRTIPSSNPDIVTALLFFPEGATINPISGLPSSFIRFYKRAKVEVVEYKSEGEKAKLMWAGNRKTPPAVVEKLSISISNETVGVFLNDSLLFVGSNPLKESKMRYGIFVATKGTTHGGGNIKFDRLSMEFKLE